MFISMFIAIVDVFSNYKYKSLGGDTRQDKYFYIVNPGLSVENTDCVTPS